MSDPRADLTCNFGPTGDKPNVQPCSQRAAWHIWWKRDAFGSAMSCDTHLDAAKTKDPADIHPIANSACGMPDAAWQFQAPAPSRCVVGVVTRDPEDLIGKPDPDSPFSFQPAPGVRFTNEQVQRMARSDENEAG